MADRPDRDLDKIFALRFTAIFSVRTSSVEKNSLRNPERFRFSIGTLLWVLIYLLSRGIDKQGDAGSWHEFPTQWVAPKF